MLNELADESNKKRDIPEILLTETDTNRLELAESDLTDLEAAQRYMGRMKEHMTSFVVVRMFPQMMSKYTCLNPICGYITRKVDRQPDLSLSITKDTPEQITLDYLIGHDYGQSNQQTLSKARCNECQRKGLPLEGKRQERWLCYLPEYLQITLQRYDTYSNKLHNHVTIPERGVDLSKYFIDPNAAAGSEVIGHRPNPIYDCYAIISHSGSSIQFGHWFTYARSLDKGSKDGRGGRWHLFNDKLVKPVSYSEIDPRQATVIFLKRRV